MFADNFAIVTKKDKNLDFQFLGGVLEGDVSVGGQRGHLIIPSNKHEIPVIEKAVKIIGLKYRIYKEGSNKFSLRIGILEIVKNFCIIKPFVFHLYSKRRKRLIDRLFYSGVVKLICGKSPRAVSWVNSELKKAGILTKNLKLTKKGFTIKNALLEMESEFKSMAVK